MKHTVKFNLPKLETQLNMRPHANLQHMADRILWNSHRLWNAEYALWTWLMWQAIFLSCEKVSQQLITAEWNSLFKVRGRFQSWLCNKLFTFKPQLHTISISENIISAQTDTMSLSTLGFIIRPCDLNSRDASLFTPVLIMRLGGVSAGGLCPGFAAAHVASSATSLLGGTHRDALAFTPQMTRGQTCPRAPRRALRVIGSQRGRLHSHLAMSTCEPIIQNSSVSEVYLKRIRGWKVPLQVLHAQSRPLILWLVDHRVISRYGTSTTHMSTNEQKAQCWRRHVVEINTSHYV